MEQPRQYSVERANQFIQQQAETVKDRYRYHYHLMAPIGWINDPNGVVYFQGAYHVFYQYYPYASQWGPMHWGHAVTTDFVNWETLPVALAPDQWYDQDGCFSGSALVKEDKLYLFYTGHVEQDGVVTQRQCMAVSEDGLSFTKAPENPIIATENLGPAGTLHDFRDPKVFQREDTFFMVVASRTETACGQILLYQSRDLVTWNFYSVLLTGEPDEGIMWECPDLFELDGSDVLLMSPIQIKPQGHAYRNISSTMVCIGKMDWETGKLAVSARHEIDGGLDFYAPQTLVDEKGRRIMIAWMQMWNRTLPTDDLTHGWSGAMTLPRQLRIEKQRLCQQPPLEVYQALKTVQNFSGAKLSPQQPLNLELPSSAVIFEFELELVSAEKLSWRLEEPNGAYVEVTYEVETAALTLSRAASSTLITGDEPTLLDARTVVVPETKQHLKLMMFRDTASLEIFVNDDVTLTTTFYEAEPSRLLSCRSVGETTILQGKMSQFL